MKELLIIAGAIIVALILLVISLIKAIFEIRNNTADTIDVLEDIKIQLEQIKQKLL